MAMASRIGRDLQAVPTQLHAAPAPRSLLAGVKEMRDTCGALANALPIQIREQTGRGRPTARAFACGVFWRRSWIPLTCIQSSSHRFANAAGSGR